VIEEKDSVRTVLTVYCFRRNQCGSFVMENITAGETVETVLLSLILANYTAVTCSSPICRENSAKT